MSVSLEVGAMWRDGRVWTVESALVPQLPLGITVTNARGHDSKQTCLGVSRPLCEVERRLKAPSQQDRQEQCELTSLGQETQLGVLGTPSMSLYTQKDLQTILCRQPHMAESHRLQPMASYRVILDPTSYYIILRHTES
jgi:hypothetical protein